MIPNFKTAQEVKIYCSRRMCYNCELVNDCDDIKDTYKKKYISQSELINKLFVYYRKKKLGKLLS